MAAIKINIAPLISELKNTNLRSFFKNVEKDSELFKTIIKIENEWKIIVKEIDCLAGKIAKEGIGNSVRGEALSIVRHCESLTKLVGPLLIEGGSFVPGPIGIVCSLALAIADFAMGNIFGGFMNLLGCIPFAKAGTKALKPILNNIVRDLLKNPVVTNSLKAAQQSGTTSLVTRSSKAAAERIYKEIMQKKTSSVSKTVKKTNEDLFSNYSVASPRPYSNYKFIKEDFFSNYSVTPPRLNSSYKFIK